MRKMKLVLAALTLLVSFQLAAGVPGANSKQPNEEKSETAVIKMTKADFLAKVMDYENNPTEWVFKGDKPCVIDFYADWCGPCRITSPILEELAQEYKGKINIYKVNVDYEKELSQVFGISGIPAFLYCPMEGKPSMTSGIARDRDQTRQMFKDNIEKLLLNN